jgi:hypothetical protein
MGRAGQRQLIHPQSQGIRSTALYQWQRLNHLERRAGIDHSLRVTPSLHNLAIGTRYNNMPAMDTFHQIAAPHFDQINRRHCQSPQFSVFPRKHVTNQGFPLTVVLC